MNPAMAIIDRLFRTIACDGPNCGKTVTFNQSDKEEAKKVISDNPWLHAARLVQAAGRNFVYCSDLCEVEAIRTFNRHGRTDGGAPRS
jgi:hypothetical protein